ncbi:MAG: metallophosphoesterase [Candidatus Latescibacteria bacterium]|nr:metallophosphoesterase [Candidatus Latescibacterota bacterium]
MRTALISDIHGNAVALAAVLNALKTEGVDQIVCLGDIAADGPEPRSVIAQLQALGGPVIMGNMDARFLKPRPRQINNTPPKNQMRQRIKEIQHWGMDQLTAEDLDFLRTFQPTATLALDQATDLLCYHGSPGSYDESIASTTPEADLERMLTEQNAAILAGGHTHRQMLRRYGDQILVNPGSVGAPIRPTDKDRHPAWAEYALLDCAANGLGIQLRRLPLDIHVLIESARASGIPHPDWWIDLRYGFASG